MTIFNSYVKLPEGKPWAHMLVWKMSCLKYPEIFRRCNTCRVQATTMFAKVLCHDFLSQHKSKKQSIGHREHDWTKTMIQQDWQWSMAKTRNTAGVMSVTLMSVWGWCLSWHYGHHSHHQRWERAAGSQLWFHKATYSVPRNAFANLANLATILQPVFIEQIKWSSGWQFHPIPSHPKKCYDICLWHIRIHLDHPGSLCLWRWTFLTAQ